MALWMDADTGEAVEELVPKPRRGKVTPEEKQREADQKAVETRKKLEGDGVFVSPKKEESYPGPMEEPPNHTEAELVALEAASEIFADDMSPEERARLTAEIETLKKQPSAAVGKSLHTKLVEVMMAVDAVGKKGQNQAQNYSYQRAVDVFNAVRPEFIKRGMLFLTEVTSSKTTLIERQGKTPNVLVEIECAFTVTDGSEVVRFKGAGAGIDASGDKSVYKAITGSMKYGIRQLLMLPDENDPEVTRIGERDDIEGMPVVVTAAPPVAVQQGGRQHNATSAQIKAIRDASRELMLTPEALHAFIASTLGHSPVITADMTDAEQAAALMSFLENLPFEECGKVVKGLMEAVENAAGGA